MPSVGGKGCDIISKVTVSLGTIFLYSLMQPGPSGRHFYQQSILAYFCFMLLRREGVGKKGEKRG